MRDFQHVHQNTALSQFRPYEVETADLYTPGSYDVKSITIPVHAILSETDEACPAQANLVIMKWNDQANPVSTPQYISGFTYEMYP